MLKDKQLEAIEIYVSHPFISKQKVAEMLGMNRNTLTDWHKNKEFTDALTAAYDEKWKSGFEAAKAKMYELAENGDYKANEFILKAGGINPSQKVEATVEHTIINVTIDDAAD